MTRPWLPKPSVATPFGVFKGMWPQDLSAGSSGQEAPWIASLARQLDGICEATVPLGRVDVLTPELAVEVEITTNWRAGARQAITYAAQTGTQPAIALFGPPPRESFERIYITTRDDLRLSVGQLILFHSTSPQPGAWRQITSRVAATAAQSAHRRSK